jgi:hypothetical protein
MLRHIRLFMYVTSLCVEHVNNYDKSLMTYSHLNLSSYLNFVLLTYSLLSNNSLEDSETAQLLESFNGNTKAEKQLLNGCL